MSKKCARCEKTVYPIEELKCLDKFWHKLCFKCQVCNMTLNMKTYKGYNKQPYCEAHIPKAKATTVAETPELKRIQENTKIQSNVMYHAEFEKAKGKFTQVADDPETLRIKQNSKIISNVAYHGDLEKKAVMEQKRAMTGENGEPLEEEVLSGMGSDGGGGGGQMVPPPAPATNHHQNHQNHHNHHHHATSVPQHQPQPVQHHHPQQQPAHYEPQRTVNNSAHYRGPQPAHQPPQQQQPAVQYSHHGQHHHHQPGKIADYDPMVETRSSPYTARQSATVIYTSDHGAGGDARNSYGNQMQQPQQHMHAPHQSQAPVQQQQQQQHHHQHQAPSQPTGVSKRVYRALYDYLAQDVDEVSFADGDIIIDCTPIDDGWMTGVVRRTGQRGMLPANYVEPAN
ncbi:LIM and SH3 domain protein F42H10.3 isoform X2 [Ischnura elegans]|uniref:LIM and SH3 domain protein F42H10.3 isoform X2 n=1 Tax=Ischnura elegans TaxID=197161 RepID=UPI001ED86A83|nr:LIM and SH3 domain protein F42H10.3 isoform X2 [Ischnura elegans]